MKPNPAISGLVDGPRLLEILFPNAACRPSLRWLRDQQKRRTIPFARIGRLIFFDPVEVRRVVNSRHTIQPRGYSLTPKIKGLETFEDMESDFKLARRIGQLLRTRQ